MAKILTSISQSELTDGTVLEIDGSVLHGVDNIRVVPPVSSQIPDTKIIDTVQKFRSGVPTPMGISFQLSYNEADADHVKLTDSAQDGEIHSFTLRTRGKRVNGLKGNSAEEISTKFKAATVTNAGVLTVESGSKVQKGDYLVPSSGETLKVTGADYTTEDAITLTVTQDDNTAPTAVAASKTYTVKRPAVKYEFNAFALTAGPPDPSSGQYRANVVLQLQGQETRTVGTPDLS